MSKLYEHQIKVTVKEGWEDITQWVKQDIGLSEIAEGLVTIYVPHTTAAITINECTDQGVKKDILYALDKVYPVGDYKYCHAAGNAHAHIKASVIGQSESIIIHEGRLLLGKWQHIYLLDFDGPRTRTFYVKVVEG